MSTDPKPPAPASAPGASPLPPGARSASRSRAGIGRPPRRLNRNSSWQSCCSPPLPAPWCSSPSPHYSLAPTARANRCWPKNSATHSTSPCSRSGRRSIGRSTTARKSTLLCKRPARKRFFAADDFHQRHGARQIGGVCRRAQKRVVALEDPSVRFLSEEDDSVDGCRAKRIEYDCDWKSENAPVVKIHTPNHRQRSLAPFL